MLLMCLSFILLLYLTVETTVIDDEFEMDFKLKHWLLGEIFSYKGRFKTVSNNQTD